MAARWPMDDGLAGMTGDMEHDMMADVLLCEVFVV